MSIIERVKRVLNERGTRQVREDSRSDYYVYKVVYTLKHLVVDMMVEYFYYHSETGEVPADVKQQVELRRLQLMSKYSCIATVEATKVVPVTKREYNLFHNMGRVEKYNPKRF